MRGGYTGNVTPYQDAFKSIIFGILFGYLALLAACLPLVLSEQDKHPLINEFAVYAIIIFATGVASVLIGKGLASIVFELVLPPYDRYLNSTLDALAAYRSQAEWPGRKFLDLLRSPRLLDVRRDFLLLGLEATLPDLSEPTAGLLDRLASVLLALELEANAIARTDLSEIARKVRGYLYRVHNLLRLRRVIKNATYIGAPAIVAWLLATFVLGDVKTIGTLFEILPPLQKHISDFFSDQDNLLSLTKSEGSDSSIVLLNKFVLGLIRLVSIPFAVYAVGQLIYIATWGLGKRTAGALDDVLWMVVSWSLAGVAGGVMMIGAFAGIGNSPPPIRAAFAIFQFLMLPAERGEKIKIIREVDPGANIADVPDASKPPKLTKITSEITADSDDPRIKGKPFLRGEDIMLPSKENPSDSKENDAGKPNYCEYMKKLTEAKDKLAKATESQVTFMSLKQKHWKEFAKDYIECKVSESGTILLRIASISWFTGMLILLLRALCGRVLRQMAAKTEQRYDDMAVELTNIFGTAILIAVGLGWILMVTLSGGDSSGGSDSSGSALLPFAILVAVAGTVMGIASRDLLTNFFAGVSLRIDKPFDVHERIVLDNGTVCEVRAIGMRSTHFFNIIENTDIYIPNSELATKTVVNLSRPDREYRRILTYWISDSDPMNVQLADRLLLLGAYSVEGIDTPTIRDEVSEGAAFYRNRPGIAAEFAKLQDRYDECVNAIIKYHGSPQSIGDVVEDLCADLTVYISELTKTRNDRWNSRTGVTEPEFLGKLGRYVTAVREKSIDIDDEKAVENQEGVGSILRRTHSLSYKFYELAMCFYTLSASYPAVRADLEQLVLEILRAPSVRSSHVITDDGAGAWKLELIIYAQLTEQSDEILHHLNLFNQRVLKAANLLPPDKRVLEPRSAAMVGDQQIAAENS